MHRMFVILLLLMTACGQATPVATPVPLHVEYTFAAQPWLADVYNCAGKNPVIAEQRTADMLDPQADLAIRVGEPTHLTLPAYQIGTEDILVVVNRITPFIHLTADQVKGLFSGLINDWSQIDPAIIGTVQVWVFPSGDDLQQVFEQTALGGTPVTSLARMANSPDEMSQAVVADQDAVGILPRHWKAGNVTEVYVAASIPVLAITPSESGEAAHAIVNCLQK